MRFRSVVVKILRLNIQVRAPPLSVCRRELFKKISRPIFQYPWWVVVGNKGCLSSFRYCSVKCEYLQQKNTDRKCVNGSDEDTNLKLVDIILISLLLALNTFNILIKGPSPKLFRNHQKTSYFLTISGGIEFN